MRLLTTLALATCAVVALGRSHREAPSRRLGDKPQKPNDWSVGYKPKGSDEGYGSKPKQGKQYSIQAETTYQWGNLHKPNDFGSSSSRSTSLRKKSPKRRNL
ncbi:unnamed protein product [Aphanomyces euteiches]